MNQLQTLWFFFCLSYILISHKKSKMLFIAQLSLAWSSTGKIIIKLEKNMIFFSIKSWFFTRKPPKMFTPPYARCDFFKVCPPPLTWNPGSVPDHNTMYRYIYQMTRHYTNLWNIQFSKIIICPLQKNWMYHWWSFLKKREEIYHNSLFIVDGW